MSGFNDLRDPAWWLEQVGHGVAAVLVAIDRLIARLGGER